MSSIARRIGEGAFRTDQQMGKVVLRPVGRERIDIVAADPAHHVRETVWLRSQRLHVRAQFQEQLRQIARAPVRSGRQAFRGMWAEMGFGSIGHDGVNGDNVVAHGAVMDRSAAARIVCGHPADGCARCGGDIHREPQTMRLELTVQLVEHDARLNRAALAGNVQI